MKSMRLGAALGALLVAQLLLMHPSASLAHLSNEQEQGHSDNENQQHQPPSSIQTVSSQQNHQDHDDHHHQQASEQHQHHQDSSQQSPPPQQQQQQQPQSNHQGQQLAQHFDTSTQRSAWDPEPFITSSVHEAHQTVVPQQDFHQEVQTSTPVAQGPQTQGQFQQPQQPQSQAAQTGNSQQSQQMTPQQNSRPMQAQTAAPKAQPAQHDQQANLPNPSPQQQQVQQSQQQQNTAQNQAQSQHHDQLMVLQPPGGHVMVPLRPQPQSIPQQANQEQQKQMQLQAQIPEQQKQSDQGFTQQQQQQSSQNSYQPQQPTSRPQASTVVAYPQFGRQGKGVFDEFGRTNPIYNKKQQYPQVQVAQQVTDGNMVQQQQQQQQAQQPSGIMESQLQRSQQRPQQSQSQMPVQLVTQAPQPPQAPPAPLPTQVAQPPATGYKYQPSILSPLYLGHNPFIEILRPLSYADDNIVTLNLSHSHIYEIDSDAFVGQRFEHIDLSNNKLGLIHSRSFRIGPNHSRHTPYDPRANSTSAKQQSPHQQHYATRRPPPAHPKSVTIDFSHNPAIVALSGAFDHIDVPNCLLNFTNSTVELKFGAFKKYFKEHPGHLIDIDTVDCCDQEWLLGYKHNFVARTHCAHDPNLYLLKVSQQTIIDSCIAYVTSARHSMTMPGSGIIHSAAANGPRHNSGGHGDNQQYLTYVILGGTAMVLTSLSIYIIFYMFSLKAAFVYQMQTQKN